MFLLIPLALFVWPHWTPANDQKQKINLEIVWVCTAAVDSLVEPSLLSRSKEMVQELSVTPYCPRSLSWPASKVLVAMHFSGLTVWCSDHVWHSLAHLKSILVLIKFKDPTHHPEAIRRIIENKKKPPFAVLFLVLSLVFSYGECPVDIVHCQMTTAKFKA